MKMKLITEHLQDNENSLIGTLLKRPGYIDTFACIIKTPDVFYDSRLRLICQAAMDLYKTNKPVDHNTIAEQLSKSGHLNKIGGRSYLMELAQGAASFGDFSEHCRIVYDNYQKRVLADQLNRINEAIPTCDTHESVAKIEKLLLELSPHSDIQIKPLGQIAAEYLADMENDQSDDYLDTRIADLNTAITGIFKGDLTVVAARPSMGKTSFCLDFCLYNARRGVKSLYIAIDERSRAMAQRALTSSTGINNQAFYAKSMLDEDKESLVKAAQSLMQKDNVFVLDKTGLTAIDIRSIARKYKRQHNIEVVVVDYIQQLRPDRKYERRDLEIGGITMALKEIAKDCNVAMIAVSQLNRQPQHKEINPDKKLLGFPSNTDLRDSGIIEQDANLILFPHIVIKAIMEKGYHKGHKIYDKEKREYDGRRAFVIVSKNKVGPSCSVECRFNSGKMLFYSEPNLLSGQGD